MKSLQNLVLPSLMAAAVVSFARDDERLKSLETGRRIIAGFDLNGVGFAVGGLAIAGAMVITRRRRSQGRS